MPILHVIKRGARGMEIVRDDADRDRFLSALFILNDEYRNEYWCRDIANLPPFTRPDTWPDRKPLVDILAYTLLDNHLHLLVQLREEKEDGLIEFARRLFRSMTGHFNEKYLEKGSIFQGPYKKVLIESDDQLRYVIPYVVLKNTLDMHPEGLIAAEHFESAWEWAKNYKFSSLGPMLGDTGSPILAENNVIGEMLAAERDLKEACRDMLESYRERRRELRSLQLED